MDLLAATIGELHEGYKKGTCTPVEVTRAYLDEIRAHNEALNAYILVTEEEALAAAEASAARYKNGSARGALDGVPCGLKDIFNTKGVRTTCCSRMIERFVPPYDASVVTKLREAGGIFLGKTNMDEFACGGSTEHSCFGVTKNPIDHAYVAGGSSGGSAAAVAARMATYAMGTDTGGSIREPAAFCGCVGLKVTYGRVSRSGVTSMASSLDTIGHFSKTVTDAAHVLQVTAGADSFDSTMPDVAVPNYLEHIEDGVKGMTFGLPKEYFGEGIDGEVRARVMDAVEVYKKLGAKIVEVSLPSTRFAVAMYYIVMPAELSANLARFDGIRYGSRPKREGDTMVDYYYHARGEGFGDEIKRRIMIGTYVLSAGYYDAYYNKALKVRTLIKQDFERVFGEVDALIGPTAPIAGMKIGENVDNPLAMYLADALTIPANAGGIPGLTVPCGKTAAGLPVGMQILAPQFSEARLFQIGRAYERAVA